MTIVLIHHSTTHEDLFENTKRKVTDYQKLISQTITILRQVIEIL